jgi:hypothetical protein
VHDFYNKRRRAMAGIRPNAAHHALARLEAGVFKGDFLLVTQNIDDLHEQPGSQALIHMHGELGRALCELRHAPRWREDMTVEIPLPALPTPGHLRPDVVWFGEMPYQMDRIYRALGEATSSSPSAPPARLPGRRLRAGSAIERRAHGGTQPGTIGDCGLVRGSDSRPRDGDRADLRRAAAKRLLKRAAGALRLLARCLGATGGAAYGSG